MWLHTSNTVNRPGLSDTFHFRPVFSFPWDVSFLYIQEGAFCMTVSVSVNFWQCELSFSIVEKIQGVRNDDLSRANSTHGTLLKDTDLSIARAFSMATPKEMLLNGEPEVYLTMGSIGKIYFAFVLAW